MGIHASFSTNSRKLFAERTNRMDYRSDWGKLPPLDIAMHPSRARFADDLSDTQYCNDRFLESRVSKGNLSAALCVIGAMHNMMLTCFTAFMISERTFSFILLAIYLLFGVGFCLNMIRLAVTTTPLNFVRFNRQAQLIHCWGGARGEQILHLPWREAVPYTNFVGASMAGGNLLRLLFPTPNEIPDNGYPFEVPGALTFGDGMLVSNLDRLEFLRRYMAHGLEAVQPERGVRIREPSGYALPPTEEEGVFISIAYYANRFFIYYAGGGPLIELWMKRVVDNYRWPDEVERLCAEGADLSGIDTTPVAAHPNLFYRYGGMANPVIYVDAQGREPRWPRGQRR